VKRLADGQSKFEPTATYDPDGDCIEFLACDRAREIREWLRNVSSRGPNHPHAAGKVPTCRDRGSSKRSSIRGGAPRC
jgi:hypothetical protein